MPTREKIELKWSKKENDWIFYFPDNAGKSMQGVFFDMVTANGYQERFKTMLAERGYDYRTFKISCNKLTNE